VRAANDESCITSDLIGGVPNTVDLVVPHRGIWVINVTNPNPYRYLRVRKIGAYPFVAELRIYGASGGAVVIPATDAPVTTPPDEFGGTTVIALVRAHLPIDMRGQRLLLHHQDGTRRALRHRGADTSLNSAVPFAGTA
jgi:hypothetical protein